MVACVGKFPFWRLFLIPEETNKKKGREVGQLKDLTVLRLVQQHLTVEGYHNAARALEDESGVAYVDPGLDDSRLLALLRGAMRLVDEVYDLTLKSVGDARPAELDELLYSVGLLGEDMVEDSSGSVWAEQTTEKNLVIVDGQLKMASVNQLIRKLTSEVESDVVFLKCFLMTYQSFISPSRLLNKLMERFDVPEDVESEASKAMKIKSRVVNVIKQWLNTHPRDFSDSMLVTLEAFINKMGVGVLADSLKQPLQRLTSSRDGGRASLLQSMGAVAAQTTPPPEPIVNLETIFLPHFNLSMLDEEELARQLTLVMAGLFVKIQPAELFHRKTRSANVSKFIAEFNRTSYFIAHCIVSHKTTRERAKEWTHWINVAQHLYKLQNFTTLTAVLGALSSTPVYRLHLTEKELQPRAKQTQAELQRLMAPAGSYRAYRDHLAQLAPPAIPYVGLLLQDLTFLDTNASLIDGLVNWTKRAKMYELVDAVLRFQQPAFNLQVVPQVQAFLSAQPTYTEDELFRISVANEPRRHGE